MVRDRRITHVRATTDLDASDEADLVTLGAMKITLLALLRTPEEQGVRAQRFTLKASTKQER